MGTPDPGLKGCPYGKLKAARPSRHNACQNRTVSCSQVNPEGAHAHAIRRFGRSICEG